jgi:hypothetical protein
MKTTKDSCNLSESLVLRVILFLYCFINLSFIRVCLGDVEYSISIYLIFYLKIMSLNKRRYMRCITPNRLLWLRVN